MASNDFQPDWASAPGETIAEMLLDRGLSICEFATEIGCSVQSAADLIDGKTAITVEVARKLEKTVGGSFQFWIARDGQYRDDASRLDGTYRDWLKQLPVGDMVRFGWIHPVSPREEAAECLRFFGTPTLAAWHEKYLRIERMAVFRTSESFESRPHSIAAWLRRGEVLGEHLDCAPWNPTAFRSSLQEIRPLTRESNPDRFLPRLTAICAENGVALVIVRAPNGCRASGATQMLNASKVLLQLSFRYLSDDHFWFTFFHECGHAVLHANRGLYLEGIDDLKSIDESEADQFAAAAIIPIAYKEEFNNLRTDTRSVVKFAQKIGISPGLVVGQLQHQGRIPRNWLNGLKRRYVWDSGAC